jgi:enamine deaminase RidA (YjgF/YER057c/UK114 family)
MERRLISSGSSFEQRFGYSRAVVVGDRIFVAGTAPIMLDDADPPADAYGQMRRCLEIVENALREAGAGLEHVVRTRVYLIDDTHADEAMRAHGEAFAAARPACTAIVCNLLDPRWLVEVEAEAVLA